MERLTPPHPGSARSPFMSAPVDRLPDGGVAGLRSFSLRAPCMTDAGSSDNLVQARYELHRALDSDDPDKARAWLRDWGESLISAAYDGAAAIEDAEVPDDPAEVDTEKVDDALDAANRALGSALNAVGKVSAALEGDILRATESVRKAMTEVDKL